MGKTSAKGPAHPHDDLIVIHVDVRLRGPKPERARHPAVPRVEADRKAPEALRRHDSLDTWPDRYTRIPLDSSLTAGATRPIVTLTPFGRTTLMEFLATTEALIATWHGITTPNDAARRLAADLASTIAAFEQVRGTL